MKGFAVPRLTTRPHRHCNKKAGPGTGAGDLRADDGIRTRDPDLGKVVLYQLSHFRMRLSRAKTKYTASGAFAEARCAETGRCRAD